MSNASSPVTASAHRRVTSRRHGCGTPTRRWWAAAVALAVLGLGNGVAEAAPPGLPVPPLPGGGALTPLIGVPGNINAPDLNGDGFPDIAVPDFGSDQLSVRINRGDGTFGPVHRYRVGSKPSFIARGDFNGDGKLDLATSNAGSGNISVLLGNGDGTLRPAREYDISGPSAGIAKLAGITPAPGLPGRLGQVSTGSFSLEALDVDGDHRLDIVTSNSISNDLSVLHGRGDGTFAPARTFPIAGAHSIGIIPFALSLGDWNHDGHPDAVVGGAGSVTIMLNDGHGNFRATRSYRVGLDVACTKVGDFNGDGVPDLAATGTGTLNTQILLGNGHGSFRVSQNAFSGGIGPQCLSVADVDRDGNADLTVVNSVSQHGHGDVVVLRGDGHGHFTSNPLRSSYPVQFAPWATEVRDFDGDGKLDLVVANSAPASVSVLRGNGDGTFQRQVVYGM
ncbi:MAG TPA: VCBS repeat-containing protein [Pseudonocardia sp.]|nr:VCBS repeat-containing protein [Pseudonocardia sp.]